MLRKLKKNLIKEQFRPSLIGFFINPFFIIRCGLYKNIKFFGKQIIGKTLDVGCGIKPYEKLFKSSTYIGMDIEKSGHNHKNSNIDVYYDGKTFPFSDEEFDSIVTFEVLEHVFNPIEFLQEINRVLKVEGKLLITAPFIWDEHEQPFDYARYSSFGLKHILNLNGFEIIDSKKGVNNFGVIFQLINAYIYKIFSKNMFTKLLSLIFVFPFTILGLIFAFILPSNNDLYHNNIILAKKILKK
jgi:SAM-dependent methyltransferase